MDQEIMKKKSFRMVIEYKVKPKVFLKWTKFIFVDFKKEVKINQLPLVQISVRKTQSIS